MRRLNLLENDFQSLFGYLIERLKEKPANGFALDHLIDSLPVMLASGSKSKRARVARQFAATGFCATRQIHFHGIRLHLIARRRVGKLPVPAQLWMERANTHDLTALKQQQSNIPERINLFGDKAYADRRFKNFLKERGIQLLTPIKKPKNKELSTTQKHYNKLVSTIRQPIESFFKWLIDKTDIQRANAVRSTDGLLIHCLGKVSFALLVLNFYY